MKPLRLIEKHFYFSGDDHVHSGSIDNGFFICGFNAHKKLSFFYFNAEVTDFQKEIDFLNHEMEKRGFPSESCTIKSILPLEFHDHPFFNETKWGSVHLLDPQTIEKDFFYYPESGRLRVKILSQLVYQSPQPEAQQHKIKVLIIDDSLTIHTLLKRLLSRAPDIEVVGAVANPLDVEKAIRKYNPDVLTVDIHMNPTDGVSLLKKIMPETPIPSLIISSLSLQDGPFVLDALEAGAVDYIQKPTMEHLDSFAVEVLEKIRTVSIAKVKIKKNVKIPEPLLTGEMDSRAMIVMGASTGGTEAVASILAHLPKEIPPILLVQHIPASFSKAFADRLNQLCPFHVVEAANGMVIRANTVYVAPGGLHTRVMTKAGEWVLKVYEAPPVNRHRPSVDVLFESVAQEVTGRTVLALLLTGMGSDGAQGLLKLKKSGALTAAQDKESCVVYGMPKVAVELGAADHVLPLEQMPQWLRISLQKKKRTA